jgi:hypothetical protein
MRHFFILACLVLMTGSASAQTDLGAISRGMIEGHILPAYATLVGAADQQLAVTQQLCSTPSEGTLEVAQTRFGDLVEAWSAVEFIRFGPARKDNRYERLFFWPDRNGRGLNQVQGVIASADESVTSVESLQGKSVALQGLLALDYVLFGTGFETLAQGNAYRCAYAAAIAGSIADTSADLFEGWSGAEGYAALMLSPGPDNPVYRTQGEALQELLRAMAEQLQIIHDAKIVRVAGNDPGEARYRRAPFWRSGQTLASVVANAEAMLSLNEAGGFAVNLPDESRRYAGTARFELGQIVSRLAALAETGRDLESIVTGEDMHGRFVSTTLPLAGAMRIIGEVYPAELGLTMGFNSLDGD